MEVVVVGASSDPERYSYKAMEMLEEFGHHPIPVHPKEKSVRGKKVFHHLKDLAGKKIDTITIYVNPDISKLMESDLISLRPERVIFNPGSENPNLSAKLEANGIKVENACTLVLLRTGQF